MGRKIKIDTEPVKPIEVGYECKNCGEKITKNEYKHKSGLCVECFEELSEDFGDYDD